MFSKKMEVKTPGGRVILWAFLLVVNLPCLVMAQNNPGQTFNPILLSRGLDETKLAVVKWAAFGSGCRSVEEIASKDRDVIFQVLPRNASHTPKLVFDLTFPLFGLSSGRQVEKDNTVELYSECALRFAIRGQAGRRLKKIEGSAKVDIHKDKGSSLFLVNELRFGQFGGDEKKIEYDEQTEIKKLAMDLNLSKDLSVHRSDGKSSCGTDQVLFYDFTMFAKKTQKASQVNVTLTAPKRATLRLEYEDCNL